jgi:chemotaxis protein histidine kinase CheA
MITPILLALLGWSGPTVDYTREVKPILAARCTSCHGAIRQKASLRLDTAALIQRGGDSGPAIEPGRSGESLIIDRVTVEDASQRMPPESEGTPLSPAEVATLRAWIDQGAHAPSEPTPPDPRRHWAFQPPERPAIPLATNPGWVRNPIDAFLDAAHRARGLKPAPPVGKDLWLRRVFLDLIGLPPTRQQLHAFRDDSTPDAEETVIDRLLDSPRYGERWGRHWMDIWRYSDWFGLGQEVRYSHPHLWHWRDWIVASLNVDKGYDRMVVEMLSGDEVAPDHPDTVRATGYLARNWDIFNRNVWLASTVEHTSRAFLGLTIQCARCHDHKFDPISQADYYRLRAFFEPYQIRVDRVPGESDRAKAGLPRAFDDFLDRPTFLFVRGEESRPDTSRPLRPSTPAVLGGEVRIEPIPLPLTASSPDKRPFVIDEAKAEADRAVDRARTVAAEARRRLEQAEEAVSAAWSAVEKAGATVVAAADKSASLAAATVAMEGLAHAEQAADDAREERGVAEAALTLAFSKRTALRAVLAAERLEDEGAKASGSPSWVEAARSASAHQRALALADANHEVRLARRDSARAQRTLDELRRAAKVPDDAKSKDARAKAAASLGESQARLAKADKQLAQAQSLARGPLTIDYTPRPLEFPRAKTTYRDTPSNAPYSKVSTGRRLALARWIVNRRNPLAARVAVNHVWARHFGEPLVGAMSDFGLRSARPELSDLLDWLAVELMDSGWSLKHLHRLIVTSEAYRMRSSDTGPDDPNLRIDPDNRYAWRMDARRMEGEVIRDSLLLLAGRLDPTIGGPDLPIEFAEAGRRRTIYYRVARDERIPLLTAFDAPNVEDCYRRHETIVPQQALAMINSGMVLTRAGQIATEIEHELGAAPSRAAFVAAAFEDILGRAPSVAEQSECESALARLAGAFGSEGAAATPGRTPEARARSALVHVLLNHNDFITIR